MNVDIIFLLLLFYFRSHSTQWSYERQDAWPRSCRGKMQSPIAIDQNRAIDRHFGELQFSTDYYQGQSADVTNTGHTVEVKILNNNSVPVIYGGGLQNEYALASFHFHWGSEHVINRRRYPLEGHFVHFARNYKSFQNALNFKDGIVVLATFYNVTKTPNLAFDPIISEIPKVAHDVNRPVQLQDPIILNNFFPSNTRNFFRYQGSLTTPNCNEVVTWILFPTPSYISPSQIGEMQSPITIDENCMVHRNYTPFNFTNYNHSYEGLITHTENAINIQFLRNTIPLPTISGGGLFKKYVLTALDLHWSSDHVVNDHSYPLEAQLIHYAKRYENLANAQNYKDGVAILSTFFELSHTCNEAIENLIQAIPLVKMKIDHPVGLFLPLIPRHFLTPKVKKFYRYNGSFTTPCFDEAVVWTLFSVPSYVEASQLQRLTATWKSLNEPSVENNRELQDLNGRRVYFSRI